MLSLKLATPPRIAWQRVVPLVFLPLVAADQALRQAAMPDVPLAEEEIEVVRGVRRTLGPAEREQRRARRQGDS